MAHALRRLGLALALLGAFAPIVLLKPWAICVTLPALAAAFLLDPDFEPDDLR